MKKLIEILSPYGTPLTIFSSNGPGVNKAYVELKKSIEFSNEKGITIEIGSHSITHESLTYKESHEIVTIIN